MAVIKKELREQGNQGELIFRDWLNRSKVAYTFLEQSQGSFPRNLESHIKRPDYLIGLLGVGTIAVDVKAKKKYKNGFALNVEECIKMQSFQRHFNITVLYAFIPPENDSKLCFMISNDEFLSPEVSKKVTLNNIPCVYVEPNLTDCYDMFDRRFMDALWDQMSLD